jgi:hypothetical protein
MFIIEALASGGSGSAGGNRKKTGYSRGIQAVGRRPAPRNGETPGGYTLRAGSAFGRVSAQNGQRLRSGNAVRNAYTATEMGNRRVRRGIGGL